MTQEMTERIPETLQETEQSQQKTFPDLGKQIVLLTALFTGVGGILFSALYFSSFLPADRIESNIAEGSDTWSVDVAVLTI